MLARRVAAGLGLVLDGSGSGDGIGESAQFGGEIAAGPGAMWAGDAVDAEMVEFREVLSAEGSAAATTLDLYIFWFGHAALSSRPSRAAVAAARPVSGWMEGSRGAGACRSHAGPKFGPSATCAPRLSPAKVRTRALRVAVLDCRAALRPGLVAVEAGGTLRKVGRAAPGGSPGRIVCGCTETAGLTGKLRPSERDTAILLALMALSFRLSWTEGARG